MRRYCERPGTLPKHGFDRRSFRWKTSGKARVLVGCPRGKWRPKARRCAVGTRAYKVLVPKRGRRCTVGREVRKP